VAAYRTSVRPLIRPKHRRSPLVAGVTWRRRALLVSNSRSSLAAASPNKRIAAGPLGSPPPAPKGAAKRGQEGWGVLHRRAASESKKQMVDYVVFD
jgi:hypothetical protein